MSKSQARRERVYARKREMRGDSPLPTQNPAPASTVDTPSTTIPIPAMKDVDMVFGNIEHLPPMERIPDRFKHFRDAYVRFVSDWFFKGLVKADLEHLTPRSGVDPKAALRAIKAIMVSWEPQHEHKEAGCAFLLSEWFELQ